MEQLRTEIQSDSGIDRCSGSVICDSRLRVDGGAGWLRKEHPKSIPEGGDFREASD